MPLLPILPVIDLKDGRVVRGIAGRRADYRPVVSRFASDCQPESIARGLVSTFGFREAYVADLDAIAGGLPSWDVYERIASCGLRLVIDAGIGNRERAAQFTAMADANTWITGIVVGLETLATREALELTASVIGSGRGVFSLDLKQRQPLSKVAEWQGAEPLRIVSDAITAGFRRVIVLDLAVVGTGAGAATFQLCQQLRQAFPNLKIISGGGVRAAADVQSLVEAGCDQVLVASALHDGAISTAEVIEP